MRRQLTVIVGATAALIVTAGAGLAATLAFVDVGEQDVHKDSIEWANENGLVRGFTDGSFRPSEPVSRGQLVSILRNFDAEIVPEAEPGPAGPPGPNGRDGADAEPQSSYIPIFPTINASLEENRAVTSGTDVTSNWMDVLNEYPYALPVQGNQQGNYRLIGDLTASAVIVSNDGSVAVDDSQICMRLYNVTADSPVANSEVCTTEAAITYVESVPFSLTSARDMYKVEVQGSATPPDDGEGIIYGAVRRAILLFEP